MSTNSECLLSIIMIIIMIIITTI